MVETGLGTAGYDKIIGGDGADVIMTDHLDVFVQTGGLVPAAEPGVMQLSLGSVPVQQDHAVFVLILDPSTQEVIAVDLVWDSTAGPQPDVVVELDQGQAAVFGVLTDGATLNDFEALLGADYAVAADPSGALSLVATLPDGTSSALEGGLLLSSHPNTATAHFWEDAQTLDIGFEDGFGGNDGDRSDLTFAVTLNDTTAQAILPDQMEIDQDRVEGMQRADMLTGSDGNIYVSLNTGDHDLDPDTPPQGAIYQIRTDPDSGVSYLGYMADTTVTTTNDGTMDPRASKPFGGVDVAAHVVMDNTSLVANTGESDQLRGGDGGDVIHAGAGDDKVLGDQGGDLIFGGVGEDTLSGGEARDIIEGGDGADQLQGENGNDLLKGDSGNDDLQGGYGDDQAFGGADDDALGLAHGDDWGFGGAGDDRGYGGDGADVLSGGDGNDAMTGNAGADTIYGNAGADALKGGADADILFGGGAADMLFGGNDHDSLHGDDGDDRIVGGAGEDVIAGGAGNDQLWGGAFIEDNSADIFVYASGGGQDMVHDFETDLDRIDLSSYGVTFEELQERFTDLGWGTEIDLSDLPGAGDVDRIILRATPTDNLGEDNFIL